MQSFAVTTTGSEVTHARVFHSGMVTVSYASHASPPEVTLSTWDSSSPINHMEVVHKALPMPKAGHQQLFETMALQGVPLVHSDAGPQLGNLQVCFFVFLSGFFVHTIMMSPSWLGTGYLFSLLMIARKFTAK